MLSRRDWRPSGHAAAPDVGMNGLSRLVSVILPLSINEEVSTQQNLIPFVCLCDSPPIFIYHSPRHQHQSKNFHSIFCTFSPLWSGCCPLCEQKEAIKAEKFWEVPYLPIDPQEMVTAWDGLGFLQCIDIRGYFK